MPTTPIPIHAAIVATDAVTASRLVWIACRAGLSFRLFLDPADLPATGHELVILHVPKSGIPALAELMLMKQAAAVVLAVFDGAPAQAAALRERGFDVVASTGATDDSLVFTVREALAVCKCRHPVPRDMELPIERLTKRQREIAGLVASGMRNKTIAFTLGISEGTLKVHLSAIYIRLGVRDRLQTAILLNRAMAAVCSPATQ